MSRSLRTGLSKDEPVVREAHHERQIDDTRTTTRRLYEDSPDCCRRIRAVPIGTGRRRAFELTRGRCGQAGRSGRRAHPAQAGRRRERRPRRRRSEEHTSELQSHSDLHSFPTRRSSDLRSTTRAPQRGDCMKIRLIVAGAFALYLSALVVAAPSSSPVADAARRGDRDAVRTLLKQGADVSGAHGDGDRKSTRLNSSHTVIYTLSLHDALPISDRRHAHHNAETV